MPSSTPPARDEPGLVLVLLVLATLAALALFGWYSRAEAMTTSWYQSGKVTAFGERFNPNAFTCAHPTLPQHTFLLLRYRGKLTHCRVNDRGPFVAGRQLDVSRAVASRLGMIRVGVARVHVERIS